VNNGGDGGGGLGGGGGLQQARFCAEACTAVCTLVQWTARMHLNMLCHIACNHIHA
jgi:hypothetical protein